MKTCKHKFIVSLSNLLGLTLVEILVTVAIIAILITIVIGVASRIDSQSKEQLTKNTLALLDAALGQFQDYGYEYKLVPNINLRTNEAEFYHSLNFPIDCNGLTVAQLRPEWGRALGLTRYPTIPSTNAPNYSGSEVLYFFLNMVPECRKTLDKIDKSLITGKGSDGSDMTVEIDSKFYPLFRFIDPWGTTLRYDYYDYERYISAQTYLDRLKSKKTFPVIMSAGPDRVFGTADDISTR